MMYGSWDIECNRQIFLWFWTIFYLFYPHNNPRKSKFWMKMKKARRYHLTHVYHKWKSYDVWFLRYEVWQKFLSFWTIICPFTPLKTRKIKILKKQKKHLEILSFYTRVPKIMIICCTVSDIWRVMDVIVIFLFGVFFALLPSNLSIK